MKRQALLAGLALASATALGTAYAAPTYSASTYAPPTYQPNPWRWSASEVDPGSGSGNVRYTLDNQTTGETRSFDLQTWTPVDSISLNRQGELLILTGNSWTPGEAYLYRNGSVGLLASSIAGGSGWSADGSAINLTSYNGSYRDMRYENGQWHTVSDYGDPNGSAVRDVNASGVAVGDTRFMGFDSWSTAVRSSNGGPAAELAELGSAFGAATWAYAIDDAGWILGRQTDYTSADYEPCCGMPWGNYPLGDSRALIWSPTGEAFDINELLDDISTAQVHLNSATGFLDDGSILATGYAVTDPSKVVTFKLATVSAVPEAQTWALMALGLAGIAWAGRRNQRPA